jgi:hypothetical protein
MTIDPDPYRTLGLVRGATRDEVRRAYRRLVKAHHPDTAGQAALPRFLAIQAAYEQLIGGSASIGRPRRGSAAAGPAWAADPDRADATRRAYGGRARTESSGAGSGATAGEPGAAGGRTGSAAGAASSSAGPTGSSAGTSPGSSTGRARSGRQGRRRSAPSDADSARRSRSSTGASDGSGTRRRNKATLGSTSYDDAEAGPFEPDWGGASWYGTTSGTYWTLNPKEYADPRKHGPEYQARARRATRPRAEETATDAAERTTDGQASDPGTGPDVRDTGAPPGPSHTTSSWWESTDGGPTTARGPEPAPAWAATGASTAPRTSGERPPTSPAR